MNIQIRKAVRSKVFLKIAVMGPAGSGKTYGSLGLAGGLAETGKILLVDTENSSASYYADRFNFDVVDMHAPFTSQKYMEVLAEAVRLGYEAIVFDSLSHEWSASGGVLDKKADFDRLKGEKWGNWQDAKKPHSLFKEAWLQAPIHVIATMRSKMEYALETNSSGKLVPRKLGLAPIQDGDSEYEFGVAFEIDRDSHLATAAKDRTGLFDGRAFMLTEATGRELAEWLRSGKVLAENTGEGFTPADPRSTGLAKPAETFGEVVVNIQEELKSTPAPVSQAASDFVDGLTPAKTCKPEECVEITDAAYREKVNLEQLGAYMHAKGYMLRRKDWTSITPEGHGKILPALSSENGVRALKAHLAQHFASPNAA